MKVVITGSSKGIGLAFAKEFLKHGDEVVISSRTSSAIDAAVKDMPSMDDWDVTEVATICIVGMGYKKL